MVDEIKTIFSKNLNALMNRTGMNVSDVSDKTGIPYSTVNDWKNGKKMPRGGSLQKLADFFHVNLSDLTSELNMNATPSNIIPITDNNMVRIPIIGTIACGDPILADENIIGYRYHLRETLPSGDTFYLKAAGDSMEPTIRNGADVLIRLQEEVEDGEIAAVLVNGDTEATLKRVKKQGDIIMLVAENSAYAPYIITELNPARILGKAVEVVFDL
nr:XRE family transcriptional regulator [uncultured Trichococcus sp.]